MSFWCLQFSQKTNENNSTWGTIVVKLNFFVCFLGELKIKSVSWKIEPLQYIAIYYNGTLSQIVFVRFLGELKTPKRHFEIKWPLKPLVSETVDILIIFKMFWTESTENLSILIWKKNLYGLTFILCLVT